jgi:hypothetical protein
MAAAEYVSLLRRVDLDMVSFLPSLARFYKLPWVSASLAPDREPSEDFFEDVHDAIYSSLPDIEQWIRGRAEQIKALIPNAWPQQVLGSQGSTCGDPSYMLFDLHHALVPLDLAVYVSTCTREKHVLPSGYATINSSHFFGLDALTHQCDSADDDKSSYALCHREHGVALQILGLLRMDPTRTTPASLDKLKRCFVCDACTKEGFLRVFTWRGAVCLSIIHISLVLMILPVGLAQVWFSSGRR